MVTIRFPGPDVVAGGCAPTPRQRRVLDTIRRHLAVHGRPPTIREIGEAVEIRSPNGVMSHLRPLERKGLIRRAPGKARAITAPGLNAGGLALPVLGSVAAGPPLEGAGPADPLDLRALFGEPGVGLYAVADDSLRAAGVAPGTHLAVRPPGPRDAGRTVVAAAAGRVGLYALLSRRGARHLHPLHGAAAAGDDARVLGVLVGTFRGA